MTSCVYVHMKPDLTPFYVGKGVEKRARNLHHLIRKTNTWHRNVVAKYGVENIIVEVLECSSEAEAFAREVMVIRALRNAGVVLTNLTDGGEGVSGRKHSEATKKRLSEHFKGRPISEKHAAVLRAAATGRKMSEEHKAAVIKANRGVPKTEAHRANIAAGRKKLFELRRGV